MSINDGGYAGNHAGGGALWRGLRGNRNVSGGIFERVCLDILDLTCNNCVW